MIKKYRFLNIVNKREAKKAYPKLPQTYLIDLMWASEGKLTDNLPYNTE